MVKHSEGVSPADASARIRGRRVPVVLAMAAALAACASPHPAPIVHRTPTVRPAQPAPAPAPAAPAPAADAPVMPDAGTAAGGPLVIETTPVPSSRVESRPLPGPGGTIAAPAPTTSTNLLKTEPRATKQPYSDALLAQLRAAPAATPGAVASAPPSSTPPPAAPSPPAAAARPAPSSAPAAADASGFVWPASGQVVQGFAEPRSMGISIAGSPGDPIVAAADGRVIFSGPGPRGYGNLVIVKHANETLSVYGHNRTLLVKEGQNVKRGQRIAELGSSGAESPQLRFEIRKDGKPVDPRKFLPER